MTLILGSSLRKFDTITFRNNRVRIVAAAPVPVPDDMPGTVRVTYTDGTSSTFGPRAHIVADVKRCACGRHVSTLDSSNGWQCAECD